MYYSYRTVCQYKGPAWSQYCVDDNQGSQSYSLPLSSNKNNRRIVVQHKQPLESKKTLSNRAETTSMEKDWWTTRRMWRVPWFDSHSWRANYWVKRGLFDRFYSSVTWSTPSLHIIMNIRVWYIIANRSTDKTTVRTADKPILWRSSFLFFSSNGYRKDVYIHKQGLNLFLGHKFQL